MNNPLRDKALQTVQYLRDKNLTTDADELNIALIESLCDEWPLAQSSTQRAAISKEIRNCIAALPKPEVKVTDEAAQFLEDLENT